MRITLPPPAPCRDCGSEPIYHKRSYIMGAFDLFAMRIFAFLYAIQDLFRSKKGGYKKLFRMYPVLAYLKLGEYIEKEDDKTLLLDQVLWQEARARGIVMREFRLLGVATGSFEATFPDGRYITFESIPFPPGTQEAAWWIDSKAEMKKQFKKLGIPVARGGAAFTFAGAKNIFTSITPPVIVKPYEGSGSRHTTVHITTEEELEKAFKISRAISPLQIIEEELDGSVYRPTIVAGRLIATIRRDKPGVAGDGVHTIEELVAEENKNPKRAGPYYSKIKFDKEAEVELARQGYTKESVLPPGTYAELNQKINWSVGGTTTDVTDEVHPDNRELFEYVAKVLHAPIVGIDFIIRDISKSWKETERSGIIECNSRPFFDNHHLPFRGEPRNVAGAIWDLFN